MAKKTAQNTLFGGLAGYLGIYSLDSCEVTADDLQVMARRHGVEDRFLPGPIEKYNAFRKATGSLADKKRTDDAEPVFVRELKATKETQDRIIRILEKRLPVGGQVTDIAEKREARLKLQHIGTWIFHRDTGAVETVQLSPCAKKHLEQGVKLYEKLSKTYMIDDIRKMVQRCFEMCAGIKYRRNGGVSFIPIAYGKDLKAMAELIANLPGDSCLDLVEFNDTQEQRENLREKLLLHVTDEIKAEAKILGGSLEVINSRRDLDELVADYAEILKKGKISKGRVADAIDKFSQIKTLVKAYEDLLGANLEATKSSLDIAKTQLTEILNNVEAAD